MQIAGWDSARPASGGPVPAHSTRSETGRHTAPVQRRVLRTRTKATSSPVVDVPLVPRRIACLSNGLDRLLTHLEMLWGELGDAFQMLSLLLSRSPAREPLPSEFIDGLPCDDLDRVLHGAARGDALEHLGHSDDRGEVELGEGCPEFVLVLPVLLHGCGVMNDVRQSEQAEVFGGSSDGEFCGDPVGQLAVLLCEYQWTRSIRPNS